MTAVEDSFRLIRRPKIESLRCVNQNDSLSADPAAYCFMGRLGRWRAHPRSQSRTENTRLRFQKGIHDSRRRILRAEAFFQDFPLRRRACLLLVKACPSSANEPFS